MPLWGKSTSAESRPKFLPVDSNAQDSSGSREEAFATTGGWALRPGQGNSGNDNTSAQAEVLVAIRGLSSTMGESNILSVDWTNSTTLAHDGSATFDLVYTLDEVATVTSASWSADQVISNKVYVGVQCVGPTDMANDAAMQMQYYSGSGTNTLTFRGTIPAGAVASGRIVDLNGTYAMATDGSAAVVDGNGTTCTWADADHLGGSAGAGVDQSSAIWGTDVYRTGDSSNYTLETVCGSSSGSAAVLTGVSFAA